MALNFLERIKVILNSNNQDIKAALSFLHSGYLKEIGWFESFKLKQSVDCKKNPIPWTTYPFVYFIEKRLTKEMIIFEFGAGNSTKYLADRVSEVYSVEHSDDWYKMLRKELKSNCFIFYAKLENGEYSNYIKRIEKLFDVVIVDGMDRVECMMSSLDKLAKDGVIILDDSDRVEYEEGVSFLIKSGFKRLDFWGISPGWLNNKCTTIFYKTNNCLGI